MMGKENGGVKGESQFLTKQLVGLDVMSLARQQIPEEEDFDRNSEFSLGHVVSLI